MKTKATRPPHSTLRYTVLASLAILLVCAMPTRGALIGYWTFDEGTGTTANDTSGVGTPHTGTLGVTTVATGATPPAWITGRFGSALDFNRLNDNNGSRVVVNNQPDLLLND